MKYIKYFSISHSNYIFLIFKILGPKLSGLSGKCFEYIGPFFRSKKIIIENIQKAFPDIDSEDLRKMIKLMWNNYGRIFAEYMFIKDFRNGKLVSNIEIIGQDVLEEIKKNNRQVIFISGHFSNFELMAMCLEKNGIKLSAIYRPLNNIFLNIIIERIRKNIFVKINKERYRWYEKLIT